MNQKTTPVLIVLLVVASFLIGKFYTENQFLKGGTATVGTTKGQATATPQAQQAAPLTIDQTRSAFNKAVVKFGKADNKLAFVEVSDPSCPYCQIAAGQNPELNNQVGTQFKMAADGGTYVAPVPEIKKLVDAGKASFALLYFPGHGNGEMGMKALYCAFDNGKFWETEKLLMNSDGYNLLNNTVKNDKTKSGEVADFLKSAVDPTKMKACLDSGKYDAQLQAEEVVGKDLMVSGAGSPDRIGTPAFFANATYFGGAYSFKDMQTAVDAALK